MEKEILRQVIRQTINEIYDQLEKELLNAKQTAMTPVTLEEQSLSSETEKNIQAENK